MASFGMGFVHAMLIDMADGSDRGSTWDRERRLADTLIETALPFGDLHEPPADEAKPPRSPHPPQGGVGALLTDLAGSLRRSLPAR